MRKGTLFTQDGKISGYWHHERIAVGDAYQMRASGKWVVIADVRSDARGPEGERFFCQVRDAEEHEIPQPMPAKDEKADWDNFFDRTDSW